MIGFVIWFILLKLGVAAGLPSAVPDFFNIFIHLNLVLFVFNLLPLPPLARK